MYIYGVFLIDCYYYDFCGCLYVCGVLKFFVWNYGFNDIGIYNKFRENVFFCVIIESLSEYVYFVLWCFEDFRVFVVMVVGVCYNGVKVYGVFFR